MAPVIYETENNLFEMINLKFIEIILKNLFPTSQETNDEGQSFNAV
jgi:hypothetical protein